MKRYKDFENPGEIVSARRQELMMNQTQLAKRLDLPNVNFISMIESKRSKVPIERAIKIAEALEMDSREDTLWFIYMVMKQRVPELAEFVFNPSSINKKGAPLPTSH